MFHIIDDMPELLDVLSQLVESAGYESMSFDSAESYLKYFDSEDYIAPVAILSDYDMTGITGLELIKQVRERLPFQKAVIISGTPADELDEGIASYVCYFLIKPYKIEKLFALLKALVECDQKSGQLSSPEFCEHESEHACPFLPNPQSTA
ncbi:MAG: response regulator [Mariprofundaceae bacterium]